MECYKNYQCGGKAEASYRFRKASPRLHCFIGRSIPDTASIECMALIPFLQTIYYSGVHCGGLRLN
jgi:hypothetical protein